MFVKFLFSTLIFFSSLAACATMKGTAPGFLEGHLKIVSLKEVELSDQTQTKGAAENYADYPLVILSQDAKKQIAKVTPDKTGNYRVALQPGNYLLDAERRARGHLRTKPQPFTVVSNQTVRVNMEIDTGVR
jgi:hypothetical protein